jgi:hypothetical protein
MGLVGGGAMGRARRGMSMGVERVRGRKKVKGAGRGP